MSKGPLYALPRTALRHEKTDYARAVEVFTSKGQFDGDPVLVAHVITHCFDSRIPFKWSLVDYGAPVGTSKIVRDR